MRIDRLDHLVLTVRDIPATLASYERVLGMRPVRFAEGRWPHAGARRAGRGGDLGAGAANGRGGELNSFYIYDPDENLVERSNPVES